MYFKRLEMHGFKSFAEPSVIEFHEGVTCIVGPNGSGKSNISDALRWVLGEQSPKMLRGGKMEEVIFSGTANRKSRGMAEVTLVIDNSAGILPIDYNEVAITRRMYRSGESEYLINNNQCRLRDIKELIMDTGIGVDGYSIIGQGKIAEIVSNKPESRREIFEEAAGVVMYKSKKTESERKLSSATANLERVNDIIAEIEGRIEGLKEDSIKAQEYLKLKEKFKELEINITLKTIERLEASNQTVKEDLVQLTKAIEELSEEKKTLDQSLAQSMQKRENLEQLGNEARDKLMERVEEINRLTNKSQLDAERLNTLDRDYKRVEEEIQTLSEKKEREISNASNLEEQKKDIDEKLKIAEDRLREKINNYNEVSGKLAKVIEDIDESKNKMYALYNENSTKKSEAKSMESYKESLKGRKEQIISESNRYKENVEASRENLEKAKEDKLSVEGAIRELEIALNKKEENLAKLTTQKGQLTKESSHLRLQIGQYNARKRTIEEMESNYEGYNGAVRFIMKSKLAGIEGVAADLIKVPAGFEVAVETALGAALQNVVCQKDKDAKEAVRALKENKAGRLTFLPVESVKGGTANLPQDVLKAKGCKGIASDIVKYNAKYKGIFSYLLGRVVIVETMEDAIDFSKKTGAGVRFVTLEGEVVNASGAITGGKYKNATANLLERKGEIEKLASNIKDAEAALENNQRETEKISREMITVEEAKIKEEGQLRGLQVEALNLQSKIETAQTLCKEMTESSTRQEQQLSVIDRDYANAEDMARRLNEEAAVCLAEADETQNRIKVLMGEQELIKAEAELASGEITTTRIEKNKWESNQDNLTQMLARVLETAEDFQMQIDAKKLQLEMFTDEKKSILFGSGDVEKTVENKNKEKIELEEYIAQVTKEKAEISAGLEEMTAKQMTMGDKLNGYQDQKYQEEIKLAKNETQLDGHKERLWEDFEISYLQAIQFKKEDFVMSTAQKESRDIKNRLKELGDVNVGAIAEYAQVSERYEFLTGQRADILEAMEQLQQIVDDMEKTIKTKFKENFDKVVVNFEEIFQKLFGGGYAELRLENEDNPLEGGIEIIAQPPGKKLQNINLMSGGEKTMTAIALMFAVLKTTPTPFCILDEVEAALDDSNIERFARYLRNFNDIQFAIVTHQKATMEHADVLYGVTMPERGISKLLSLRLGDNFEL